MQRTISLLIGAVSALPYGLLPTVIASVVGGLLFGNYALGSMTTPPITIGAPAGTEKMQMIRDEHELMVNYLYAYAEARQKNDFVAEEEMLKSRAAGQAAMLAENEAKVAETRALAIAANVTTTPERKAPSKKSAYVADKETVGEPLQLVHLASATTQTQPVVQSTALMAGPISAVARSHEAIIKTKLRQVTAMLERVPLWVNSVSEWFSGVPSHRVLHLQIGMS